MRDGRTQHHLQSPLPGGDPESGKTSGSGCQFIGGQGTEEHADLHSEGIISKIQPGGFSTGQRGQVLQVNI